MTTDRPEPRPPDVVDGQVLSVRTRPLRPDVELGGEHLAVAVMTLGAVGAAVMTVIGLIGDLNAGIGDGLAAVGYLGGGVAAVAVLSWLVRGRSGSSGGSGPVSLLQLGTLGRVRTGHAHGAGRALLRHEGGHLTAAERTGVRVTSAVVGRDSGLVTLRRSDVDRMSSRDYMAFMKAGGVAGGGSVGCSADRANVRAEKARMRDAGMSAAQINRVERQADGDARGYGRASRVDHWADQLGKRGRL